MREACGDFLPEHYHLTPVRAEAENPSHPARLWVEAARTVGMSRAPGPRLVSVCDFYDFCDFAKHLKTVHSSTVRNSQKVKTAPISISR